MPITLNFSAQTSSARTQEMIETKLERKKKTVLGAPVGKRVIVFVDDVNMPKLDTYGSQPPIELLRYDYVLVFQCMQSTKSLTCTALSEIVML